MSEPTTNQRQPAIPGLEVEATAVVGIGLGLTGLALGLRPRLAPVALALTALTAALFRNPRRVPPDEPRTIFAVADGQVQGVREVYEHRFVHSDCLRLTTVVGPLDVPICRAPTAGRVVYLEQLMGDHRPLRDPHAPERNQRLYIGLETAWGPILLAIIASPLGRWLRCETTQGATLNAGARIASIRFGGQVDLYIQRDVLDPLVAPGARTLAGRSRLGAVVA
ncbi:phosphatidylserine decarboxylase [Chloroflexus sp. MS-CIW-1]|jgi:phosphatidylserine decarboxylase|uniref:phosphatidylserine decarboxylase n=1 Tax=Chloroflexus sp. MS-CIW-1 TaxID=3055768 RepID=UPI001B2CAD5F|nr:phosphatidylserine decarboxylase [Chloroflexus sp. MS-CIW-1]MBO9310943.1 phosphatidylserine decarboxylase [Chloroflexus sp.]MBO9317674.1 phosphatidylserine decarboxylase [Chloroflexus sp.]MBO9372153.1 phosphatidylserine decarboxylase [Chloroflexus sp.]MDN5271013.1 phosphatidylserine decarboxylase [Chloroflexus sp. MS-CIW-1]